MDQPNLLEIRHLNLTYKGTSALTDLTLAVRPGEIHALLGENGAGKTTLLKLLGGLRPGDAYTGEILREFEEVGRSLGPGVELDDVPVMQRLARRAALAGVICSARFFDVGVPEGYREAVATFPARV